MFNDISFSDKLLVLLLVFLNFAVFYFYYKKAENKNFWLLPFTFFNIGYLVNYPLKAIFLVYGFLDKDLIYVVMPYSYFDLLKALAYSTAFYILFNACSIYLLSKVSKLEMGDFLEKNKLKFENFSLILGIVMGGIFLVKFASFKYYGLGREVKYNYFDIMLSNLEALKYLSVFSLLCFHKIKNSRFYIFFAVALSSLIIIDSTFSTSKAPVFVLLVVYILYSSFFKIKVNKMLLTFLMLLGLINFYYSYTVRYYGNIVGAMTFENAKDNFDLFYKNMGEINSNVMSAFFNRFELLDNLIYTMKRVEVIDKSYFAFGSITEIANLVPRKIWPEKPSMELGFFIIDVIHGKGMQGVSASFGRIGESFFVLGYFGLLYVFVHVPLMFFIYYKTLYKHGSLYLFIFYLFLYFVYFMSDNYLFQGLNNIILNSVLIFLFLKLAPNKKIVIL